MRPFGIATQLTTLPGVEPVETTRRYRADAVTAENAEPLDEDGEPVADIMFLDWRLSLIGRGTDYTVAFGPRSGYMEGISREIVLSSESPRPTSMFISWKPEQDPNEAFILLERVASAVFFEFDVRYDLDISLDEYRHRRASGDRPPRDRELNILPPQLPRTGYAPEAVSLYFYARSTTGLPLLQFLAFYQAIEYHFPFFTRRDVLARLRRELHDPRFNVDNDAHLTKLVNIATSQGRSRINEEEQLRITLEACIEENDLVDLIERESLLKTIGSKDSVRYAQTINQKNREFSILSQVARRIYDIRCRVVHSKEDGGPRAVEPILPFSEEATQLASDLVLLRYVAQKVIIVGGLAK